VSAIRRFANVAKRSGAAEVYAVARDELEDVRDLGRLLLHLRRVDPGWTLDMHERRRLAYALLEANVAGRDIADQLDISQKTLSRRRQELVDERKRACEPALQSGVSGTKTPSATRRSSGRILHAEASSGNGDFEAIGSLLGVAA
jgi:hypothetical protein